MEACTTFHVCKEALSTAFQDERLAYLSVWGSCHGAHLYSAGPHFVSRIPGSLTGLGHFQSAVLGAGAVCSVYCDLGVVPAQGPEEGSGGSADLYA